MLTSFKLLIPLFLLSVLAASLSAKPVAVAAPFPTLPSPNPLLRQPPVEGCPAAFRPSGFYPSSVDMRVSNIYTVRDPAGSLHIFGLVTNLEPTYVHHITVMLNLCGRDGRISRSSSLPGTKSYLYPGESTSFVASLEPYELEKWGGAYSVVAYGQLPTPGELPPPAGPPPGPPPEAPPPPPPPIQPVQLVPVTLNVSDVQIVTDEQANVHILGLVTNPYGFLVENVVVRAAFYDALGGEMGSNITSLRELRGNQSAPFGISFRYPRSVTGYRFYSVEASAKVKVAAPTPTGSPSQAVPIQEALQSIGDFLMLAITYDGRDTADPWKLYDPTAPPFAMDLNSMKPGMGYWISVAGDCTLRRDGGQRELKEGWNLIGWPP